MLLFFCLVYSGSALAQEHVSTVLSVSAQSTLGEYGFAGDVEQPLRFNWQLQTSSLDFDAKVIGRLRVVASVDTLRSPDDKVLLDSLCTLPAFNYSEHPLRHALGAGTPNILTTFFPQDTVHYSNSNTVVTRALLYSNTMRASHAAITSFRKDAYDLTNKVHLEVSISTTASSGLLGKLHHTWEVGVGKTANAMDQSLTTFYLTDSLSSGTTRLFLREQFFSEAPTGYSFIVVRFSGYFDAGYRQLPDQVFSLPIQIITDPDAMVALERREHPFLTYGKVSIAAADAGKLDFDSLLFQARTLYQTVGRSLTYAAAGDLPQAILSADAAFRFSGLHRQSALLFTPPDLVFDLYAGIGKLMDRQAVGTNDKMRTAIAFRESHAANMRHLLETGYADLQRLILPDTLTRINEMEMSGFFEEKDLFRQPNILDLPVLWRERTVPAFQHFLRVGDLEAADKIGVHVDEHIQLVAPLWKQLAADSALRSAFHWLGNAVTEDNEMLVFLLERLRTQQQLGLFDDARHLLALSQDALVCSDQTNVVEYWSAAAGFYEGAGNFQAADSLYQLIDKHWASKAADHPTEYTEAYARLQGHNADLLRARQLPADANAPPSEQWGNDLETVRKGNPFEYISLLADPQIGRKLGFFNSPVYQRFYFNQIKQLQVQHADFLANAWLKDFAFLLGRQRRYREALMIYERLFFINNLQSIAFRLGFPEETQLFRTRSQQDVFSRYLNVLAGYGPEAPPSRYDSLVNLALEQALFQHAFVIQGNRQFLYDISRSTDPAVQRKTIIWQELRKYLNDLYLKDETSNKDIALMRKQVLQLEGDLARMARDKSSMTYDNVPPLDSIRKQLREDEAAIEIVRYTVNHEVYYGQESRYAALVIRKHEPVKIVWFPTEGKLMDGRYFKFYRNAIQQRTVDGYAYKIFWEPLQPYLQNVTKVYWAPDGVFHLLNPATLYNPVTQKYLLDEISVHVVPTVAAIRPESPVRLKSALVLGNPDFGVTSRQTRDTLRTSRQFLAAEPITPLPGTAQEAAAIGALLAQSKIKVTTLTAKKATKQQVFNNSSSQLMHIATHGFWIDRRTNAPGFFDLYETLSGSGLILADAQEPAATGYKLKTSGILTAAEIQDLQLYHTELVVLSACETGLGEIIPGQGLYGLKRALQKAGARHVMTSLWKVDDAATNEFMTQFYRRLSQTGQLSTSYQAAMSELRKKYPDPYYWGAFVLTAN